MNRSLGTGKSNGFAPAFCRQSRQDGITRISGRESAPTKKRSEDREMERYDYGKSVCSCAMGGNAGFCHCPPKSMKPSEADSNKICNSSTSAASEILEPGSARADEGINAFALTQKDGFDVICLETDLTNIESTRMGRKKN